MKLLLLTFLILASVTFIVEGRTPIGLKPTCLQAEKKANTAIFFTFFGNLVLSLNVRPF